MTIKTLANVSWDISRCGNVPDSTDREILGKALSELDETEIMNDTAIPCDIVLNKMIAIAKRDYDFYDVNAWSDNLSVYWY